MRKIKLFPIISLIISIILYIGYAIDSSNSLGLAIIMLTLGQLVTLSILYLGVPLIMSITSNSDKMIKFNITISWIYLIVGLFMSPLAYLMSLLLGAESSKIHNYWITYIVAYVLVIAQLIYNSIRKKKLLMYTHYNG